MQHKQRQGTPRGRVVFRVQADGTSPEGAVVNYLNQHAKGKHVVNAQEKARAALKAFLLPEACYMEGLPELEVKRRARQAINLLYRQALEMQAEYLPETMATPQFAFPVVHHPIDQSRQANVASTELFTQEQSSQERARPEQGRPNARSKAAQDNSDETNEVNQEAVQKFLGSKIGAYSQISF